MNEPRKPSPDPEAATAAHGAPPLRPLPRPARPPYTLVERAGWALAFALLFVMLALTAGRERVIVWLHGAAPASTRGSK